MKNSVISPSQNQNQDRTNQNQTQNNPSEEEHTNKPTDNEPEITNATNQALQNTLPEKTCKNSHIVPMSDQLTDRARFMKQFNREGANNTRKRKPAQTKSKGRSQLNTNCQDIRKFYTFKSAASPPPTTVDRPGSDPVKGKVSIKSGINETDSGGTDGINTRGQVD